MKKLLFVAAMAAALGVDAQTRIVLYSDTEDYTCDAANDGIRDFANVLTEEGVRGCFNITGYLALRIQEFGRQDVIRALKPHCLGTQTLYHSLHPTPAEIADDPSYERAYRRALMDESKATAMVEAVFGEGRSVFTCPPGKSISTPAMEAWYDLGYTFAAGNGYSHCGNWGAQVARPGWTVDGLWYCNLYQPPYTFLFSLERLVTRQDLSPDYFKKVLDTLAQYDFAGVGFHPSMQLRKAHWDTVNYKGGNNVPWRKWNVPPARDPEDTAGFYRNLRAFLRAVKADGRFAFTDFDEMKKGVRPRVEMRPEHLKAVRASLERDFNCIRTPASWSVADCFYAVVGFLRGEKAYRPTKVYGFLERPVGVTAPVEVTRKGLAAAAKKIDLSTFLPPSVEVDGRKIGPADFLFAALEALTDGKERVTVVPREQLGSFKEVPDLETQNLANTWIIFGKDFKDKYVSERFRLQLWTLRIDPVRYPEPDSGAVTVQPADAYNSWPMIGTAGGRLVCAYSRGSGHTIGEGKRGVWARTSSDGGKTWSDEVPVCNDPRFGEVTIGKGRDESGAMLLWVRCWGNEPRHHDLYRTTDGLSFEKIATPEIDPVPMQITDVIRVPGVGLLSLWFSAGYDYVKDGRKAWGTLTSADNGRTWTARTVETDLKVEDWPTEPSAAYLGDGRILAVARSEGRVRHQFQIVSTDSGRTWKKFRTNITDVAESTPSLIYDPKSGLVSNYYYQRGAKKLKRRVARADFVFSRPQAWPDPETLFEGWETRAYDAGNVNAVELDGVHYAATYTGSETNTAVLVVPTPAPTGSVARDAMNGRFTVCGVPHQFRGGKIDWSFNPTYNNYSEWPWQFARMSFLRDLADTYAQTKDEKAAEAYVSIVSGFIDTVPPPGPKVGPGATKSWRTIDTGLRATAWADTYFTMTNSPAVTDAFKAKFFRSLEDHLRRLEPRRVSNNWRIMELRGLVDVTLAFPSVARAEERRRLAEEELAWVLRQQLYPDGFQFELSTGYHTILDGDYAALAQRYRQFGRTPPAFLEQGIELAFELYPHLTRPDRRLPALNDAGMTPIVRKMRTASALFPQRADFRWFATDGREGAPPDYLSYAFPYSGAVVFRTSWTRDAIWAYVDMSPFGYSHQHEDKLNFLLHAYGTEMLCEGGCYAYDTSDMRKYVLSTRSHNTVRIDAKDQNARKSWKWTDDMLNRKADLAFSTTPAKDVARASYALGYGNGRRECDDSVVHTRTVEFVKDAEPPYFRVTDELTAKDAAEHSYEQLWHLEKCDFRMTDDGFTADFGKGVSLEAAFRSENGKLVDMIATKEPALQGWLPISPPGPHEHRPIHTPVLKGTFVGKTTLEAVFRPRSVARNVR